MHLKSSNSPPKRIKRSKSTQANRSIRKSIQHDSNTHRIHIEILTYSQTQQTHQARHITKQQKANTKPPARRVVRVIIIE